MDRHKDSKLVREKNITFCTDTTLLFACYFPQQNYKLYVDSIDNHYHPNFIIMRWQCDNITSAVIQIGP